MSIDISASFSESFYGGAGTSALVPFPFDIAINGRPYMLDDQHEWFKKGVQSIMLMRAQADTSTLPGEGSTNPEDLWPRPRESWHKGAGQRYADRGDSDPDRFYRSFGVDPWEYGKLKPLPSAEVVRSSNYFGRQLCVAGSYLYVSEGDTLYRYLDADGVATTIHTAGSIILALTSDGYNVWFTDGANVFLTTRGAGSASSYNTLDCTKLKYVKGRLMAAKDASIYNITSGSAPSALFTHPTSDWEWVDFAEGQSHIYAAGYAGDKSSIYRIPIKEDGTGLDTPLVAATLPDGEVITALCGYLGFVAVGTTRGFRLAIENSDGSLTLGALVDLEQTVRAFEPQDRFIFFTWEHFDNYNYTGIGRMDLSVFSDPDGRVPAYATDIMVTDSLGAEVSAVATVNGFQVFAVNGDGVYRGTGTPTVGWLESGLFSFGVPDYKIAMELSVAHEALEPFAYVNAYISDDDRVFQFIATSNATASTGPPEAFTIGQMAAKQFEIKLEIDNAVIERTDLRAYPVGKRGKEILVPILLHEQITLANESTHRQDPSVETDYLENLASVERLISYQELDRTVSAFISQVGFERHSPTKDRHTFNGTALCRLKVLGV